MTKQTVLVVGGSGFIGQHATKALAAAGHKVYATHGPARTMTGAAGITWLPCDLTSAQATETWPGHCDTVIYLAQARQHRNFPDCSREVFAVNVVGLQQALEYGLRSKAKRFVFTSSGSIYPPQTALALETDQIAVAAARSYYVASKVAAEILLGPYAKLLPSIILRLFMPYGWGQKADMLLPQIVDKVRSGKPIFLHDQDGLRANPVAVADVAEALVRCLALEQAVTMNVAGPEVLTLRKIGEAVGKIMGRPPHFEVGSEVPPNFIGATTVLRHALDWEPRLPFEEGLRLWLQPAAYPLAG